MGKSSFADGGERLWWRNEKRFMYLLEAVLPAIRSFFAESKRERGKCFTRKFLSGFESGVWEGEASRKSSSHAATRTEWNVETRKGWRRSHEEAFPSFLSHQTLIPFAQRTLQFFLLLFKREYVSLNGFHLHLQRFCLASVVWKSSSGILFLVHISRQQSFSILFPLSVPLLTRVWRKKKKDSMKLDVCCLPMEHEERVGWGERAKRNRTRVFVKNLSQLS